MQVDLTKPKLQKFIDDQVRAGHFPSAQAAVETAVEQMMLDHGVLDDSAVAAITNADAQYDRGEYVDWRDVRDALREKYLGKK
jgi:Arc/MetJ-type ribon-helix-helix transcriptional regulator